MDQKCDYLNHVKKSPVIGNYFPNDLKKPLELWSADEVKRYQFDALSYILKHAYENSAFYKDKYDKASVHPDDFKEISDIENFPFVEKDELRGSPWKLLAVPKHELTQIHVSTGTTSSGLGDHIYSLFSWDDIYADELAIQMPLMIHSSKEDLVINALPYEMSSAGIAFHRSFQHGTGATVVNVGKGGHYSGPEKTLLIMKDIQASVLITTPSYAVFLSEKMKELGLKKSDFQSLKYLWLTGEGCSFAYRKRLEEIWNVPCFLYYGSLEGGPLDIECIFQDGYHIPQGACIYGSHKRRFR